MRRAILLAFVTAVVALIAAPAQGVPIVTLTGPSSGQAVTYLAESPPASGSYDITLTTYDVAGTQSSGFKVEIGGPGERLGTVLVESKDSQRRVDITLGENLIRFASINMVSYATGEENRKGFATVTLFTDGDLGSVVLSEATINVGGNVNAGVYLSPITGFSTPARLQGIVNGNFTGDILLDNPPGNDITTWSRIFDLKVDGRVGTAAAPITIKVGSNIRILRCGELHAHISSVNPEAIHAGYIPFVGYIEVNGINGQPGVMTGSIRFLNFVGLQAGTTFPHIDVRGSMNAQILMGFSLRTYPTLPLEDPYIRFDTQGIHGSIALAARTVPSVFPDNKWTPPSSSGSVPTR